jgi:uncharacterized membrane protein
MFGFFFGTVCLFGLMGVARRAFWAGRYGYGGGCHGGGGWHGRRGWHGRGRGPGTGEGFARAAGEIFKRRLRIDEEQEGMVDHALIDLRKAVKELSEELKGSRAALADAFRGETVDDAALAAVFARHDDALGRARRDVVSSLKQVHAVLDADQRKRAADWLASADGRWS